MSALREPVTIAQLCNCPRCGREYSNYSSLLRSRLCGACKKPKTARVKGNLKDLQGVPLTVREWQVVELVTEAQLNKEIAHILHLSEGTIKVYISNILAKTGLSNRTALAVWSVTGRVMPETLL